MTSFKEMHGEYIYYDNDGKIIKIEWYTHDVKDCELDITDGNQSISVTHKGMINNLEHSTEVVAIGEYNNGLFQAEEVLVKCPSKYEDLVSEDG